MLEYWWCGKCYGPICGEKCDKHGKKYLVLPLSDKLMPLQKVRIVKCILEDAQREINAHAKKGHGKGMESGKVCLKCEIRQKMAYHAIEHVFAKVP